MDSGVDALQDRLIVELRQLIEFLRSQDQRHWEAWFLDALRRVEAGDASGLLHIESANGGMGSFGDLLLLDDSATETLQLLRTNVWSSADELRLMLA